MYASGPAAVIDDKAAIASPVFLAAKRTSELFGLCLPTEVSYVAVAAA